MLPKQYFLAVPVVLNIEAGVSDADTATEGTPSGQLPIFVADGWTFIDVSLDVFDGFVKVTPIHDSGSVPHNERVYV